MRIATVEFRRVKSLGKLDSEMVGATAEVGSEGPEQALDALRAWIDAQVGDEAEARALRSSIRGLEWQRDALERQVETAERRWAAIQGFLARLGIERPSEIPETLEHITDGR